MKSLATLLATLTFREMFFPRIMLAVTLAFAVSTARVHADEPLARVDGDLTPELRDILIPVLGDVEDAPRSLAQARRRAEKAANSATSVMRSQGYYAAEVDARVVESIATSEDAERTPPRPVLTINPGSQFKFADISIAYTDETPNVANSLDNEISLRPGEPAIAARVVAAELRIVNYLNAHGYPEAKATPRDAIVDYAAQTMSVTYNISSGRKTRFGEIQQTGTAYLSEGWPRMVAPFESGDLFDARKLNTLSGRIIGTGVFDGATAVLEEDAKPNGDGTVTRNILLNVEQGAINTVSGEVGYSTTDGSGVDLAYERRNFIGYAQTLTLSSTIKTNQISFGADYNIPFAFRVDRELDLGMEVAKEDTEAFKGERVGGQALLTQKFSDKFKMGLGVGLEASRFEENGQNTTAYLFEGLGRATYDARDNILDPETGFLLEGSIVPTYNFGEEDGLFNTVVANASAYQRVSKSFVAAGRVKAGTIVGTGFDSIPLNRRFYGGGGGSVRGFGYQTISPRNADGDEIGGQSIVEASAELRYHGESPFGFAAFVDAASVNRVGTPDFEDIRYGAGIGARYYTSFAPLRADIAIPLNKRDGDNDFQIYISIGQAF